MSGMEVISLISAIIGIINGTSKLVKTIKDSRGLPDGFNAVSERLPLIRAVLQAAERRIKESTEGQGDFGAVQALLESCQDQALRLKSIMQDVTIQPGATFADRSLLAVRRLAKEGKMEQLMKRLLENVQLLAAIQTIKPPTDGKVPGAIQALADPAPSIYKASAVAHYGIGHQFSNMGGGQQHVNMGKGQQIFAYSMIIQGGRRHGIEVVLLQLLQGPQELVNGCIIEATVDQDHQLAEAIEELTLSQPPMPMSQTAAVAHYGKGDLFSNLANGHQNINKGTGAQYIAERMNWAGQSNP
ncbi:hypothetical protein NCS56_01200500 [Fusarium sp. Ph1]|nr:hypothetical protein NCS56_01200500 [Fusarium sp. Ph1]